MLSRNSWTKGMEWAKDPSHVKNIMKTEQPDGRLLVFGRVANSRGWYQDVTALVTSDMKSLIDCNGGTVENGIPIPYTYHVAALLWAAKNG